MLKNRHLKASRQKTMRHVNKGLNYSKEKSVFKPFFGEKIETKSFFLPRIGLSRKFFNRKGINLPFTGNFLSTHSKSCQRRLCIKTSAFFPPSSQKCTYLLLSVPTLLGAFRDKKLKFHVSSSTYIFDGA